MFYNHDFLTRRKGGLGVVWLAATLGTSRSVLKKVTRKEVEAVNIAKACETVASPPEPIALRLSSQLMFGVVRIYCQRSEQFFNDVQVIHANVRKTISGIQAAAASNNIVVSGENIDLPSGTATKRSIDQITMHEDNAFFAGDFDQPFDWDWELQLASGEHPASSNSGISSGQLASTTAPPSPVPSTHSNRHIASKDKITLASRRMSYDDYGEEEAFRAGADLTSIGMDTDECGGGDHRDIDLGLNDGAIDLGFDADGLPSMTSAGPVGRRETIAGDDTMAEPPNDGAFDMMMDEAPVLDGLGDQDVPLNVDPVSILVDPAQPRPAKKRVTFSREDARIELSEAEVRRLPQDYVARMQQEQREQAKRQEAKAAEQWLQEQLYGAPADLGLGPELTEFWVEVVGGYSKRREALAHDVKKALAASKPTADDAVASNAADQEANAANIPGGGDFDGIDFGMDQAPDIPQAAPAALPSMGPDQSDSSVGVGRNRGVSISGSTELPWNTKQDATRDDISGSLRGSIGGRRMSEMPDQISLGAMEVDAPERSVLGLEEGSIDGLDKSQMSQSTLVVEKETENFFLFAKEIHASFEDPSTPLKLTDLAPIETSQATVAAQAFYHVLQLATNHHVRVAQKEPYGEIEITLLK